MKNEVSSSTEPPRRKPAWLATLGKVLLVVLLAAATVWFVMTFFPGLIPLLRSGNVDAIEAYLQGSSTVQASMLFLMVMQAIQVVSVVIPALPIHIAAGAVLGLGRGFLLCWLAFTAANWAVFTVLRTLAKNRPAKTDITQRKGLTGTVLRRLMDTGSPSLFVLIANIIPFLPNGIIPYAAAATNISGWQFTVAVALGSALPTLADCAVGNAILGGDLLLTALIFGALFLLAFLLYHYREALSRMLVKFSRKK